MSFYSVQLYSQRIDSLLFNKKFLIAPTYQKNPELGHAFGIGGLYRFLNKDTSFNKYTSTINFKLEVTTKKQYIFESNINLAHPQGKWLFKGDVSYKKFPFRFYGIGNGIDIDSFSKYNSNFYHYKGTYYKEVKTNVLVGLKSFFEYFEKINSTQNALFNQYPVDGLNGGRLSSLGMVLLNDNRNQNENTWNGHYTELYYMRFDKILGSQYNFDRVVLDLRKYIPLHKKVSSATQIYGQSNTGNVPFYALSMLGGEKLMRGYFKGAYRQNIFESIQTEIRYKFIRNWEIVGFGGLGVLGSSLKNVDYSKSIKSAGLGLRVPILFGKKLTLLRFDFAMGKNSNGFYFGVGEAF